MNRRVFPVLALAILLTACGNNPPAPNSPRPDATSEVAVEATAEAVAPSNSAWVSVQRPDPAFPGWEFQHPEGWETVELDERNIFLYTSAGVGERLFGLGLDAGQLAFQFSLNHVVAGSETPESHLRVLTGTMRGFTFGDVTPYSAAGLTGVQQTGVNEQTGVTVLASSREIVPSQFIDIFAYSRTGELEANRTLMSAVIETVRYALPTE